jgi:hypothetical protein
VGAERGDAVSAETDHLTSLLSSFDALSLTVTSAQRSQPPGPGKSLHLGLTSFGWSNLGSRTKTNGVVTGLFFQSHVWFSDRVTRHASDLADLQRFAASDDDPVDFSFTVNGEHVRLHAALRRWNSTWDADSFMFDSASQQLLFRVPGAGPAASPAILVTSFGPGAGIL